MLCRFTTHSSATAFIAANFGEANYDWHDPHYWYFENIEDPNDRGYDALRRIFLREIADCRTIIAGTEK